MYGGECLGTHWADVCLGFGWGLAVVSLIWVFGKGCSDSWKYLRDIITRVECVLFSSLIHDKYSNFELADGMDEL